MHPVKIKDEVTLIPEEVGFMNLFYTTQESFSFSLKILK